MNGAESCQSRATLAEEDGVEDGVEAAILHARALSGGTEAASMPSLHPASDTERRSFLQALYPQHVVG